MANYIQDVSSSMPTGGYSVAQLQNIAQRAGIGAQTPPQATTAPATPSNLDSNTFALTPDELALQAAREAKINASKTASDATINSESDYQNQALNAMQAEINATNEIYAKKLQAAQLEGQGRLGSEGAIQARRGLLGSDFGAAQTQDIRNMNTDVNNAIGAELSAKLSEIMGQARTVGSEKYAAAAKAKKEGLDAYLADIGGRVENNKKIAQDRAKHFMTLGVDPNTIDKTALESIAKAAGVTSSSILSSYKDEQDAQKKSDLVTKKAEAEINKYATDQANATRQFNENVRQFGMEYALKKQELDKKQSEDQLLTPAEATAAGLPYGSSKNDLKNKTNNPDLSQKQSQINAIRDAAKNVGELAYKSGSNTAWEKLKQNVGGATAYSNLVAEANTLRTRALTLLTDPGTKKFFGPAMSNADVQFMMSGGTPINPELQTPEKMKSSLTALMKAVDEVEANMKKGKTTNTGSSSSESPQQVMYNGQLYIVDANGDMTVAE